MDPTFFANLPLMRLVLTGFVFATALAGAPGEPINGSAATDNSQQATAINATPLAGPHRPANVPEGYVITPFGYFHSSCLQSLSKGERLLADGRVQHANGSVNARVAVCGYPHYLRSGMAANTANARSLPEISGWVESASITTGSADKSYGALIATWRVPSQPYRDDGQVLYLFPGFEDINGVQSILQPVLGWYNGQWTIASWNCCLNGVVTNSPAVGVSTGDRIYGSITNSCPPGTHECPAWSVLSVDLTTGDSTTLGGTPSNGQAFNWAFGGVLEAYYINSCDDYPSDRQVTFEQVTVFNQNLHPLAHQKWSDGVDLSDTPQCGYGLTTAKHKITVAY
jgi:hypothetical protein